MNRFLAWAAAVALSTAIAFPPGLVPGAATAATAPRFARPASRSSAAVRATVSKPDRIRSLEASSASPVDEREKSVGVSRALEPPVTADQDLPLVDPLAPAVPGELVVVLDTGASAAVSERALEARGATVKRVHGDDSAFVVTTPGGLSDPVFNILAEQAPGVAWAQPNYIYRQAYVPADPRYRDQWALPKIGAPAAWDVTRGSNSVVVAVVDTGVDYAHADLAGQVDTASDYDFVNGDADAADDNGHGTHVAGIVAATEGNGIGVVGVAPRVHILPVKVLDSAGTGDTIKLSAGIRYAADNGAKVINLSVATSVADARMASAVSYAHGKGCVIVAAAGNEHSGEGADYPARYPEVVGVGAVDQADVRASFSNYGTGVDVWAPGVDILSTYIGDGYVPMSGTSMASPVVAGVAALVYGLHPTWTPNEVSDQVVLTAPHVWASQYDSIYGVSTGRVRADRAVATSSGNGPDDEIPGVELPASPVSGTLNRVSDRHDVYSVYLGEGQSLEATLSDSASSDFDLALFSPDAKSVGETASLVAGSTDSVSPDAIGYTATASGWYYLDAYAYKGEGPYTLAWKRTGSSDDNLPGAAIPDSPFLGSLDSTGDIVDVYSVPVRVGDQLTVYMAGPDSGADFDLWLFGPDSTSIDGDAPLVKRESSEASELLRYVATETGTYSVMAYAYSGSGVYQMDWSTDPFVPDDNIPGVELPSPVTATIGGLSDTDDVYKVFLQAGQSVEATLTGLAGDRGAPKLYVFDPTSTNVDVDFWVAEETSTETVKPLFYVAEATGYHYLDVYSGGDPDPYLLEWALSKPSDDNIPGLTAGSSRLAGDLGVTTDTDDVFAVHAVKGQQLVATLTGWAAVASESTDFDLYAFAPGSTDVRSNTPIAKADGARYPKTITIEATRTAYYYLLAHAFAGEGSYTIDWSAKPHVAVAGPYAPSSVTHRRSFTVYGYVSPRHSSGTYLVDLRFYKKDSHGGDYVYYKTVRARRVSYSSSSRSKFSISTTLPSAGKWCVRAYHSDTAHAPTYSGYDYITVK